MMTTPPVVDLLVSASSVNENAGSAAAVITALLDHAATVDTLVTQVHQAQRTMAVTTRWTTSRSASVPERPEGRSI